MKNNSIGPAMEPIEKMYSIQWAPPQSSQKMKNQQTAGMMKAVITAIYAEVQVHQYAEYTPPKLF